MNTLAFKRGLMLAGMAGVILPAAGQVVLQDGFESGTFAGAWGLTAGVTILATGGANGTANFARLAAYTASTSFICTYPLRRGASAAAPRR